MEVENCIRVRDQLDGRHDIFPNIRLTGKSFKFSILILGYLKKLVDSGLWTIKSTW